MLDLEGAHPGASAPSQPPDGESLTYGESRTAVDGSYQAASNLLDLGFTIKTFPKDSSVRTTLGRTRTAHLELKSSFVEMIDRFQCPAHTRTPWGRREHRYDHRLRYLIMAILLVSFLAIVSAGVVFAFGRKTNMTDNLAQFDKTSTGGNHMSSTNTHHLWQSKVGRLRRISPDHDVAAPSRVHLVRSTTPDG